MARAALNKKRKLDPGVETWHVARSIYPGRSCLMCRRMSATRSREITYQLTMPAARAWEEETRIVRVGTTFRKKQLTSKNPSFCELKPRLLTYCSPAGAANEVETMRNGSTKKNVEGRIVAGLVVVVKSGLRIQTSCCNGGRHYRGTLRL